MVKMTVIHANMSEQTLKKRVGAYCRVSTQKKEQLHSFEAQKEYFTGLYNGSDEEELVAVYADTASGTSSHNRPFFSQMLEDCRQGKIDRIVTKSISRFARNTRECLSALRELKKLGITVLFEKEGIDTAKISDEIIISIMEGLAQEESASISRNIRWGLRKKMASGTLGIARIPYGYQKSDGLIQINESTAAVVRRIFSLYLSGKGAKAIAALLNCEEILSPCGGKWSNVTILKILRQEKYIGDIRWQKTYSVFMEEKSKINRGEQDSFYVRDCLPAIISRDDFMAAQSLREKNTRAPKKINLSPFRRKTKCTCGRSYYYKECNKKGMWVCSAKYDETRPCINPSFSDEQYHAAWMRLCQKLEKYANEILMPCVMQCSILEETLVADEMHLIEEELRELHKRKYVIFSLFENGCITMDRMMTSDKEIDRKISVYEKMEEKNHPADSFSAEKLERLYRIFTTGQAKNSAEDILLCSKTDGHTIEFELLGGLKLKEEL